MSASSTAADARTADPSVPMECDEDVDHQTTRHAPRCSSSLPNAQHYSGTSLRSAATESSSGSPVDHPPHYAFYQQQGQHGRSTSFGLQSTISIYRSDSAALPPPSPSQPQQLVSSLLLHGPASSIMQVQWQGHRWMTDISEAIAYRRLNQVRMLGSHDAGTYNISAKSEFGPDAPALLRKKSWGCLSSIVKCCAKPITHGWAKTQHLTVEQQLLRGVRYLDLRAAYNNEDGKFYVTHSLMSLPFADVVAQVASFMSGEYQNTRDVIVMDIQHLFGVDLERVDLCRQFFSALEPLEDLFFPPSLTPESVMSDIWATPYRILLCVGRNMAYYPSYVHHRPAVLQSPWHNCNSKQALMDCLLGELQSDLHKAQPSLLAAPDPSASPAVAASSSAASPAAPTRINTSTALLSSSSTLSNHHGSTGALPPRGLYITQAVISPYVSDIVKSVVPLLHNTPRSIRDYAGRFNALALRWFRDVNLSQFSRKEILSESMRREHQSEADRLGVVWHHEVVNTHANILMLDYIEDGLCEWYTHSEDGTDPTGERCVLRASPSKNPSVHRRRQSLVSTDLRDGAYSDAAVPSPSTQHPSSKWHAPSSAMIDGVTLCVYINIHLHRVRLLSMLESLNDDEDARVERSDTGHLERSSGSC